MLIFKLGDRVMLSFIVLTGQSMETVVRSLVVTIQLRVRGQYVWVSCITNRVSVIINLFSEVTIGVRRRLKQYTRSAIRGKLKYYTVRYIKIVYMIRCGFENADVATHFH